MRTRSLKIMAATLAAAVSVIVIQAQPAGEVIPDKYIVQLKPGVDPATVALGHGAALVHVYKNVINGYAGFIPPGLLARVAADPRVETIVPDRVVEAYVKPGGGGGGGTVSGQVVPAGVARIGAVGLMYDGTGIGVAIVDTGIDLNHTDLGAVYGFTAFGELAQDDAGHGTHVAGIVAARNNEKDVVGVAPNATLYAVKVLNSAGSGSDSEVISGLNWIAENAKSLTPTIKVANMSLGRPGTLDDNPSLRAAVQGVINAGVTVVVAAGNDCSLEVSQQVPAGYPEVIAVASTTAKAGTSVYRNAKVQQDVASFFTTDGAFNATTKVGVTISAPGEDQENVIFGYRLASVGILSTALGGGTTRMYGTSMAAPHVAGVVALLQQQAGGQLDPEQVRSKLMNGAVSRGVAPANGVTGCYSFDGVREGILWAPGALEL